MAFHVACPLTCRKICYCSLGSPGLSQSLEGIHQQNVLALERLLAISPFVLSTGRETVEVLVPRLTKDHKKKKKKVQPGPSDGDSLKISSFQEEKPLVGKKVSPVESVEAESNGRAEKLVEVDASDKLLQKTIKTVKENSPNENIRVNVPDPSSSVLRCSFCSSNEISGSEKAINMLSCKNCSRYYHRRCLKQWAKNRDLFNWEAWVCSFCRYCEVCNRTDDANLLMFCKRCDEASHSYCQQPPLKHAPSGPYLCPKHTRCHSCGSRVPGSGISSRWFLSYNFCDACGRLFVKGKYCPICLKVYRESEPSPMVCCDVCEHWVHCTCDGISEERYQQFQRDDNLLFKCATCRGECHQIKDTEDAVRELWKRRDDSERDQIDQLRASLGIHGEGEPDKFYPPSDDDKPNHTQQGSKKEIENINKGALENAKVFKNGHKTSKHTMEVGINKLTSKKTAKRALKNQEGLAKAQRHDGNKLKLHFQRVQPEKLEMQLLNGYSNAANERSTEAQSKKLEQPEIKINDKKPTELHSQPPVTILYRQANKPRTTLSFTGMAMPGSFGSNPVEGEGNKMHMKPWKSKLMESEAKIEHTAEKKKSTKLILDLSANEFKKSDSVSKVPGSSNKPSSIHLKPRNVEIHSSGKREHSKIEGSRDTVYREGLNNVGYDSKPVRQGRSQKSEPIDSEGSFRTPKATRDYPPPAWGTHSDSRRRRLPSSKFRDMDTNAWHRMSSFTPLHLYGAERSNSNGSVSGSNRGLLTTTLSKKKIGKEGKSQPYFASSEDSQQHPINSEVSGSMVDEKLPEPSRKKVKVKHFDASRNEEYAGQRNSSILEEPFQNDLKLKFKKHSVMDDEKSVDGMHEKNVKGQRTKRKQPETAGSEETSEDFHVRSCFPEKIDNRDDTSILQRLGFDAVAKRVEVFQLKKNNWHKGTIVAVFPHKSQFSIQYDNGDKKTQKYGKERVRLLSTSKRSSIS